MFTDWKSTTFILCSYGFFKEIRPSEPFLTEYLIGNSTGLTASQLYQDVYPIWTYSYLAVLVIVFLFTDLVRYKPVIVFEGFAYILTWVLLLWGHGLATMQFMQVAYGVATSTEVAYFTYIYAQVPAEFYQQVTSFTRTALLLGRFLSGVLAQLLISFDLLDYRGLNYISLAMVSAATLSSFLLPSVKSTIYFHRNQTEDMLPVQLVQEDATQEPSFNIQEKFSKAYNFVKKDFVTSFSNVYILKWSIWWALGMCGNFQVGNYIQPLWEEIKPAHESETSELFNGGVEAATTLVGAGLAFVLGFTKFNWSVLGEGTLAIISVLDAVILYLMATTSDIWTAYVGYLVFRSLYQMMITVASFEIASNITQNSYGLVFGFNTFLALSFQTILTSIVADSVGLALPPRDQFQVYAGFFLTVGLVFLVSSVVGLARGGVARLRVEGMWLGDTREREGQSRSDPPIGSTECPQ